MEIIYELFEQQVEFLMAHKSNTDEFNERVEWFKALMAE